MPAYAWRAVDAAGRAQRGVIEAAGPAAARLALRGRALLPTAVEPVAGGAAPPPGLGLPGLSLRRRPGGRALAQATRQLATLIGAQVRVDEALRISAVAATGPMAGVLGRLLDDVREGRALHQAMASFPAVFSDYYRACVAAGERSGKLDAVFERLADFVEARAGAAQKVGLALLYPALLAVVSLAVVALLMVEVVPDIVRAFTARGAALPPLTRGLIALSAWLTAHGATLLAALACIVVIAAAALRRPAIRLAAHRALARAPLAGPFVRRNAAAQVAGVLGALVQSGAPLVEALEAAAAATGNLWLRRAIIEAAGEVREGASLSSALTRAGWLPPALLAMVASGEGGGALGPALARAAAAEQRALEALAAALVALVEPLVLLVMGGIVLLLVMAILAPIAGLNALAGA